MFNAEKDLYQYEKEIKPNRYSMFALAACIIVLMVTWLLNEAGIFRVQPIPMRVGCCVSIIALAIPFAILISSKKAVADPAIKYLVIGSSIIFSIAVNILLIFHTTLMLIFPILLAMIYRSKKVGILAMWGTIIAVITSPILAYLLGVWDVDFLRELIFIATTDLPEASHTTVICWKSIYEIFLYIIFPRVGMCAPIIILMFYVIEVGSKQIDQRVQLTILSYHDNLTGLYNRNYFDKIVKEDYFKETIGIIFFDVNDLKKANDTKGHEYGDLLLQRSAESIKAICDEKTAGFRFGGDEFVVVMENVTERELHEKHELWKEALKKINEENETKYPGLICEIASGIVRGHITYLDELLKRADKIMYDNKQDIKASHQVYFKDETDY